MKVDLEDVANLVAVQLGRRHVAPGDRIVEDLGAESLDVVNVIASVEDRYQIEIPETEVADIHTVEELFEVVRARRSGRSSSVG
jgi:acyl carrier protein